MSTTQTYVLVHPVELGKENITELVLKPTGGAFRNFKQRGNADGTVEVCHYDNAVVAVRMSGRPDVLVDRLHPEDMMALSGLAMSFFGSGQKTETSPSP